MELSVNVEPSKTLTLPVLVCEVKDRGDGVKFDGEDERTLERA